MCVCVCKCLTGGTLYTECTVSLRVCIHNFIACNAKQWHTNRYHNELEREREHLLGIINSITFFFLVWFFVVGGGPNWVENNAIMCAFYIRVYSVSHSLALAPCVPVCVSVFLCLPLCVPIGCYPQSSIFNFDSFRLPFYVVRSRPHAFSAISRMQWIKLDFHYLIKNSRTQTLTQRTHGRISVYDNF